MEVLYPYGFPLTTVKRIVNMDEEVKSISSDALKATSKAAEMIVQALAREAFRVTFFLRLSKPPQALIARSRLLKVQAIKNIMCSIKMDTMSLQ